MRKKKWADPYLTAHPEYALPEPEQYRGNWRTLIPGRKLHLELGMGKGDYLNAMAAMYPEDCWIGVEKDHSAAAVACRKALEAEHPDLHNKRVIVGNADQVVSWFAPGEVDVIHLNFSDPWPKTHTHKRRLSSERFLELYRQILAKDGQIRLKTDNKDLFEDSVLSLLHNGFTLSEISVDYRRQEHPEDAITEYESRFLAAGQPIYQLAAVLCRPGNDMLE